MSFLTITGLSAKLRGTSFPILRDVSLRVSAGEVHGLVGESGAGKSMIGKAVLGILPTSVEITKGRIERYRMGEAIGTYETFSITVKEES